MFGGSGSTLMAAEKTGRRARLCELDPIYCDRILARWEVYAKDDAERLVDGQPVDARHLPKLREALKRELKIEAKTSIVSKKKVA